MRLITGAADTGGRYTVLEQVTPPGWGRRVTFIRARTRFFTFLRVPTSYMSAMSVGLLRPAPLRSCPAAFHTAFGTWRLYPVVCYASSLLAD